MRPLSPTQPLPSVVDKQPRRRGLTLRVVIGLVSALTVLVVASATFAITYTQSLATVQDTGLKYASALTTGARLQMTDYFDVPTKMGVAIQRMFREPGIMLPSDDPTGFDVVTRMANTLALVIQYDWTAFQEVGLIFDDGSISSVNYKNGVMFIHATNCLTLNQTAGCCCTSRYSTRFVSNMSLAAPVDYTPSNDQRFNLYATTRSTLLNIPAFWSSILYSGDPANDGFYAIPTAFAVFNSTRFMGLLSIPVRLNFVTHFIKTMSTTPNSYTFILDNVASIVATTYPANVTTLTTITASKGAPNCASSVDGLGTGTLADPTIYVLCRSLASNFEYAPLREAALDDGLMSPTPGTTLVKTITAGGNTYYAASAGVYNPLPLFKITVLLLMPDTDIVGDIYTARNTVLIIVAVILLIATGTSFVVTAALLKPLDKVSKQMVQTSRLRDVSDDDEQSAFDEIRNLQSAYTRMNTAIKSFTRYVPKEVVKDLMQTGQLCEIRMQTMKCTMLFVDIAGFTSMCERVPSDELSRLVRSYFEVMSGIVMNHEGLIDKFIGDCIMAVWGAPFAVEFQEMKATLAGLLIDHATRRPPLAPEFDAAGEILSVRVGIASGEVLAGNMGSEDRMSYTVIGDPVNVAARLESLNKQFGTRVMIAETTAASVSGLFALRELMHIAVVGKLESCRVYEVMGLRDMHTRDAGTWEDMRSSEAARGSDTRSQNSLLSTVSSVAAHRDIRRPTAMIEDAMELGGLSVQESDLAAAQAFTAAVEHYHVREFAKAIAVIDDLAGRHRREGTDKAAGLLRRLCEEALRDPESFDGVWRADQK